MDKQKLTTILFIVGIILVTATPALQRFTTISDTFRGFIAGLGIGLLLLAVFTKVKLKRKHAYRNR